MSNDTRRRRRISPEEPSQRGGGIPIFPLMLVVVFVGLLLGGILAKYFGSHDSPLVAASPMPSITPIVTPQPTATLAPSATPSPDDTPSPSATPSPVHSATPAASANPSVLPSVIFITPSPQASPSATAAAQAEATPTATPATMPKAESPIATPAPAATGASGSSDRASAIVRAYLAALARGDESTAAGYLASGLPYEKFMGPGAKIVSVDSSKNPNGSYKVTADVVTSNGEYFETFTLEGGPGGLQITDHYAIKPR